MSETLGDRIKQAYKGADLNRNQFAKRLGTVYHNVIRWETGAQPGPEYLKAISEITGVSVDWLLNGERKLVSDDAVLRVVEEFEASLDGEELAEYRELGGPEWGKSLAFAADAMRQLGTEPTPSLVRRLWGERRGQLSGKLRAGPRIEPTVQPKHRAIRKKGA